MTKKHVSWLVMAALALQLVACQAAPAAAPAAPATATALPPSATPIPPSPTTAPPTATPVPPTDAPVAEPVLEIVGPAGTHSLTLDEIKAMDVVEGQAGQVSSTGKITLPEAHRGVTLKDLAELVGPLDETMGVNVVAKDGYGITFSFDQLANGSFIAYDPANGEELKSPPPLTALVAFERGGEPLPVDADGMLRMAIISPEGNQVTDGHWSVKWVSRLEVKPLGAEWSLELKGALTETIDRATFESCASCHGATWTDDHAQVWKGVPLWMVVGYVDDEIKHSGPAFNDALAEAGYTFDVTAIDGYTVPFDSARVSRNDELLLANTVNGNPLPDEYAPLRLVGSDAGKKEMVGAIAGITLTLEAVAPAPVAVESPEPSEPAATAAPTEPPAPAATDVEGDLVIVGAVTTPQGFTEADLRALDVVSLIIEHPKKGSQDYEGVRLNDLLALAGPSAAAKTIAFVAADGYTSETDLATVQACADCLLAFTDTPASFNLGLPDLPSDLWAKDLVKIELK